MKEALFIAAAACIVSGLAVAAAATVLLFQTTPAERREHWAPYRGFMRIAALALAIGGACAFAYGVLA